MERAVTEQPSDSFSLLQFCLTLNTQNEKALIEACQNRHNWDIFLAQVEWHRIAPTLQKRTKHIKNLFPKHVERRIDTLVKNYKLKTQKHILELKYIDTLFKKESISYIVLKGPVLSQKLYNDPYQRTSKDLDILIEIKNIERVTDLLEDLGYSRTYPSKSSSQQLIKEALSRGKDFIFFHPIKQTEIELHWHWHLNPHLFPLDPIQALNHREDVFFDNACIPSLAKQYEFLYLLTHGARSHWARLSWLSDIHGYLETHSVDWSITLKLVEQYDLWPTFINSLYLCQRYFNLKIPEIEASTNKHRNKHLIQVWQHHQRLISKPLPPKNYLIEYFICTNSAYRKVCLLRTFGPRLNDMATLPLPKKLHSLYFFLRPFLYIWRHVITQKPIRI